METINLFCLSTEVKQGKTINETKPFETRTRVSHIWIKAKLKLEQQSIRPRLFSGVVGTLKEQCHFLKVSENFIGTNVFCINCLHEKRVQPPFVM